MRSRNIKPGLFKNEILGTCDPLLTIIFIGLWCAADKKGRIEDRPLRLKAEILPYRENIDFNGYLTELSRLGFIQRYVVDGIACIQVVKFEKHQNPHHTEKESVLPCKIDESLTNTIDCDLTVIPPLDHQKTTVGLLLIPDSGFLIPDSNIIGENPQAPKKENEKPKRFVKPSIEEILAYCIERKNGIDAQNFFDHYEANGWMRGKNKIKDWKACIRTWEKNTSMNKCFSTGSRITDQNLRASEEFINGR